jgi:methionyl-tRNA synthetase
MENFERVYVTTPIYYVNDVPHVGHAYTTVAADVVARYWRRKLGDDQLFFQVGTDEHGQKIADAAAKASQEPTAFADALAPQFIDLWQRLSISSDAFLRTTDPVHEAYAQRFFQQLYDQGDIYKDTYRGLYCVGCEEYKVESDLVNGRCPLHPNLEIQHQEEENYFFRLTKYAPQVQAAIESNELVVLPEERRNEVLARLKSELRDLSISRQSVSWGIQVPWDAAHTFYVWVEALLNYLSVLEANHATDFWPPTHQFMAKDILWFHAAIWPALLLAGGKPLPKTVFAHGFFTVDGQKMSKTVGNVIDPHQLIERYGVDATRYLLISAVSFGSDGDLKRERFDEIYTGELSNGLGNLLQRTVTLIKRSGLTIEPGAAPSCADVDADIEALRLDEGLRDAWKIVADANKRLEDAKPWELLSEKREVSSETLEQVLTTAYRQLETIAAGIAPYMPTTSDDILSQIKTLDARPLFPRLP